MLLSLCLRKMNLHLAVGVDHRGIGLRRDGQTLRKNLPSSLAIQRTPRQQKRLLSLSRKIRNLKRQAQKQQPQPILSVKRG